MSKQIGELSRALLNKKVGFVRITKPQAYRQDCEVAAWYTAYESDLGDYDLTLRADGLYPENLSVHATVPATVTSNYHAPLLCGVAVGKSRDDRGQRGNIPIVMPWALAASGRPHGREGLNFVVAREYLDAAAEYCETMLRHYADDFPNWYKKYLDQPRNDFNSNVGMVAAFGGWINEWGRFLEEILRQKEYRFGSFARYERIQGETEEQHQERVCRP